MKSSHRLRLSPEAQADVRSIRRYSARQWGAEQRDRYVAQLQRAMERLIDHPEQGRPRDELYAGCRSLAAERHVIFYYLSDEEVVIDRILHGNQDAGKEVAR